jgi:hypothetical protein
VQSTRKLVLPPLDRQPLKTLLVAAFACLAGFKFHSVMAEDPSLDFARVAAALLYAALFGSPQLFWLAKCGRMLRGSAQAKVAVWVAVVFALLSIYFGSFPGTQTPSWAGEAHFEVPAAFLVEWFVALVALVPFRAARPSTG